MNITNRFLIGLFFLTIAFSCKPQPKKNIVLEGPIFGTSYKVIYNSDINFQKQFDSLFYVINKSLSTYQVNSDISKLNRNENVAVDHHFIKVFESSKTIYKETNGAFDPTIGGIVNAWDFGPEGNISNLDSLKIDSLMQYVGLNKVKYVQNKIVKPLNTYLDFNAIAKGYAVDVLGEFLESRNIENYLINIGGELRSKGINIMSNDFWKVGVEDPNFDGSQSINKIILLKDQAMATSGTYRKFYVDEDGNRYAHIIDAKTGYPSQTNLLSISVIAENCMLADAYATAFKSMGLEQVQLFLKTHPELKVFLIFENDEKLLETRSLNGFLEN
ncbi:FAD:protein FMN transferase [Changchengzhania lutea]|uniref:FAD:protein FMN transferase n=1 Tax=Changchengzhania lutea TaxID=2049305 RepID=UPI00115D53DD|nr:FAD:protein FMN transferase [Changchengzhania lutea]